MIVGIGANLTITSSGTIVATSIPYDGLTGTVPTWNQNTTGIATNITAASNSTLNTLLALPYTQLTGTPTIPSADGVLSAVGGGGISSSLAIAYAIAL